MNTLLEKSFDRYGYTSAYLREINQPKYQKYVFMDEDKLIFELEKIRKTKDKIIIYSDFDMDGISAGTILYAGLELLGFDVSIFAPDTSTGYGFQPEDVDNIFKQFPDCKAIITSDVGITCADAVLYAHNKYECSVFITDHHLEGERVSADVIVDPSRYDEVCEFKGVCGAYVAYHMLHNYAMCLNNPAICYLIDLLDIFVSLGSLGDLMPLKYDTRIAVISGLEHFNSLLNNALSDFFHTSTANLPEHYVNVFANLKQLHYYLLGEKIVRNIGVTETTYGFTYCPLFNSVKRMSGSMEMLFHLLYDHYDIGDESFYEIAEWLVDLNHKRKALVKECFAVLSSSKPNGFNDLAPFIYTTDVPYGGIYGLVAMNLMQCSDMPTFVIHKNPIGGYYSGSGRLPSWAGLDLIDFDGIALSGHAKAFGIVIEESKLNDFYDYLVEAVPAYYERVVEELSKEATVSDPRLMISFNELGNNFDFDISVAADADVCMDFAVKVLDYGPFGSGFEKPEFKLCFKKSDIYSYKYMGDGSHLKLELPWNIYLVFFGGSSLFEEQIKYLPADTVLCFTGTFEQNVYFSNVTLQFVASDYLGTLDEVQKISMTA